MENIKLFFDMIEDDNIESVKKLLEGGVDPNTLLDIKGYDTPLLEAIDNKDVMRLLLEYGADPNFSPNGNAVLNILINQIGNTEIIRTLLMKGANPNIPDHPQEGGNLPLLSAVEITCGYIRSINDRSVTKLTKKDVVGFDLTYAKLLLKYGAFSSINEYSGLAGMTPLYSAANDLNIPMIKLLLDFGADTSVGGEWGDIPRLGLQNKEESNQTLWEEAYKLLDPMKSPYLRSGKHNKKFIIYDKERVACQERVTHRYYPTVLANFSHEKNDKYLYHDIEIVLFLFWSIEKHLLTEETENNLLNHIDTDEEFNHQAFLDALQKVIGNKLLISHFKDGLKDYFLKGKKSFIIAYLTTTGWNYSLHSDFKSLFSEKYNRDLTLQAKDKYDDIFSLFDQRLIQYKNYCKLVL